jgi:Sulfotransferase family
VNVVDAQTLIEQAVAQSGVPARGESYRPGLDRFLDDFNASTTLTSVGREAARNWVVDTLAARFAIEDWTAAHAQALDVPIERPVFILGLPRAGTTALLNLLALDPQHRVYWNWEANREVPPVEAAHLHDDPRVARKVAEVNAALACGALDERMHVEMGDEPGECVWLMAQDFKSYAWLVLTAAPSYCEWLLTDADIVAAFRHHKRALQLMQSRAPGQWLLKHPSHACFLDALLAVYPDARIVVTHRDPIRPLGSSCDASHHITAQFNAGLDPRHVGRETLRIIERTLEQVSALRDAHPRTEVHDIHYLSFVQNPIGEIKRLYEFLGQALSDNVQCDMRNHLAAQSARRAKIGPHRYSLADYGLSRQKLPRIFADYVEQFGIEREGL